MKYNILFITLIICVALRSQTNFELEVKAIQEEYAHLNKSKSKNTIFTGSSSIRIWKNLPEIFGDSNIINSGFGGSKASDLLYYIDELVLDFNPKKVVIYEGDNDIDSGQSINFIYQNVVTIIEKIKALNDDVQIILISAKPSISRWHLKNKYIKLNKKYKNLAHKLDYVKYADIWSAMLENGFLKKDIFVKDGLHLNEKGYKIWEKSLKKVFH